MPERQDFLPVCNDQGIPLVEFQARFCVRCVQPECSRSRAGGLFETRVSTWQERLFKNPPRMAKDDPLYQAIRAKRFIEIDVGRIPEVGGQSAWVDPRSLEEASPHPRPKAAKPPKAAAGVEGEVETPPPAASLPSGGPLNTPYTQGTMLDGAPAPVPQRPIDRWSAPVASPPAVAPPGAPIVKPGAVIKFK